MYKIENKYLKSKSRFTYIFESRERPSVIFSYLSEIKYRIHKGKGNGGRIKRKSHGSRFQKDIFFRIVMLGKNKQNFFYEWKFAAFDYFLYHANRKPRRFGEKKPQYINKSVCVFTFSLPFGFDSPSVWIPLGTFSDCSRSMKIWTKNSFSSLLKKLREF